MAVVTTVKSPRMRREKPKEVLEASLDLDDEEESNENKPSASFTISHNSGAPLWTTKSRRNDQREPFSSLPGRNLYRVTSRSASAHTSNNRPKVQLLFDIPKRSDYDMRPSTSVALNTLPRSRRQTTVISSPSSHERAEDARVRRLEHENRDLRRRVVELEEHRTVERKELMERNERLRRELEETKAYVDRSDILSEQQYSNLSSQLEEMMEFLEEKDKAMHSAKKALLEASEEVERHVAREKALEATNSRQRDVIESLREELDRAKCKIEEFERQRETLENRAVVAIQRLSEAKEENANCVRGLYAEREFLRQELEKTDKRSQKVIEMEERIKALEETVRSRDAEIKQLNAASDKILKDDQFAFIRRIVFKFITSNDHQRIRILDSISKTLAFDSEEEAKARSSLRAKAHLVGVNDHSVRYRTMT